MTPIQITTAATAVANLMAEAMTDDELALFAAVFTQLGDTLATIALFKDSSEQKKGK